MKKFYLFVNIIILLISTLLTFPLVALLLNLSSVNANIKQSNKLTTILFSPAGSLQQSSFYLTTTPSITPQSTSFIPSITSSLLPSPQSLNNRFNLIYYCQDHPNFGHLPLPGGCTISEAGCGPTVVAMILSGLINPIFTPQTVTAFYKPEELNCKGSSSLTAKKIFKENGLLTEMIFANNNGYQIDQVAQDLQEFIKAGWLIFTLGRFYYPTGDCQAGCNHFFVIVNVDSKNVWVFDPYYGCNQPAPINILKYNQSPYKLIFKLAMAVKKPERNL